MVGIIEVDVIFGIGMSMTDKIMRNSIRMCTRKKLRVDVMRPLREKWSRTPFCTLTIRKNILEFRNIYDYIYNGKCQKCKRINSSSVAFKANNISTMVFATDNYTIKIKFEKKFSSNSN